MIEAARISALRTALVSFVAAKRLATLKPLRLGLIGCGPIGLAHLEIFLTKLAVESLVLYDSNPARVADAIEMVRDLGFRGEIEGESSASTIFRNANCIVLATTVTSPYVRRDMLQPGQTLLNASLDDLAEDVFYEADQIWVDDLNLVLDDERRLLGKILRAEKEGRTSRPLHLSGSIDQLIAGVRIGRMHKDEIIILNAFGMAILDLGIASIILKEATDRQYGERFDFEA